MGGEIIICWLTGLVTHTECLENIWVEKDVFRLVTSVGKRKNMSPWEVYYEVYKTSVLKFDSSCGLRIFSLSHARDKTKNIFLYFFTAFKTYHLSYSVYKRDAIDIADPSSMQDACHMNFVIDLAHRGVFVAQ